MTNLAEFRDYTAMIGSWTLDPYLTVVAFRTKAVWVMPVKGTFGASAGHGSVGADGRIAGSIVLDAASIATGNAKRDEHLRSKDFLDAAAYPTFVFTALGARPGDGPGQVHIDGVFAVAGEERPLTIAALVQVQGTDATVTAELQLDRGDWGVSESGRGASRNTHISIRAVFSKVPVA